jgi:putative MATE family efflux protein
MQQHTERLGTAPLGQLLIALSLPGIASSVTTSLYNIVNTIWVARLGHEAIAALTIVFPYQILFYAIGGGTGIGIGALVSRRFGERDLAATNHIAGQIFFISAFWGLLFIVLAVAAAEPILHLLGATPDIIDYARQYLVITSYGAPMMILAMVMSSLIRGSGDAVKPMTIMITGAIINVILDPLLILGIGPFPELKVAGAALGTLIAQSCGALLAIYYFFSGKTSFRIRFEHLKPDWEILKDIYHVGAPSIVLQATESLAFTFFNIAVSKFGSVAIAAVGIVIRVSDLAFMPMMGVQNGLLPIIGYCFGASNYHRLWDAVKKATFGLMGLLALITIILEAFAPGIIRIFTREAELITITIPAFRIMLSSMVLIGPSMMIVTTFQGLSKGGTALGLSLLRQFIVFIPLLFLFRHIFGLTGIWVSAPAADTIGVVVSLGFIWYEYRRQQRDGYLRAIAPGINRT